MTEIDDRELSQRLRALRVEPPATGFEARLAERLLAAEREPAPAQRRGGRVIVGPWLRRRPVHLIGATALFLAGAAAALEGGVVEWVQARVQAVRHAEPPPLPVMPAAPAAREPAPRAPRIERPAPPPVAPDPAPLAEPEVPRLEPRLTAPRLGPERAPRRSPPERRLEPAPRAAPLERRLGHEAPDIPRLQLDHRRHERAVEPGVRLGRDPLRSAERPAARERGRALERLRELAPLRSERATENERPRGIGRVRERRERLDPDRRELLRERAGRERRGR